MQIVSRSGRPGSLDHKAQQGLKQIVGKLDRLAYIQILEKQLLPFIAAKHNGKGYLFQQDNAPIHTAKDVKEWIVAKKIKLCPIAQVNHLT